MPININIHFPDCINLHIETVNPTELGSINQKLDNLVMKLKEAFDKLSADNTQLNKALGEIQSTVTDLKDQIEKLSGDPDLTPDQQNVVDSLTETAQKLDDLVPDSIPPLPVVDPTPAPETPAP